MKYALNLGENGRILSATYARFASEDAAVVEALPEGDISQYLYLLVYLFGISLIK